MGFEKEKAVQAAPTVKAGCCVLMYLKTHSVFPRGLRFLGRLQEIIGKAKISEPGNRRDYFENEKPQLGTDIEFLGVEAK